MVSTKRTGSPRHSTSSSAICARSLSFMASSGIAAPSDRWE
jgi:hypothetical protein